MAVDLMQAFDCLPEVVFGAKDRESRYVAGNRAMLIGKNLRYGSELLGKTDLVFHPLAMAEQYMVEDRRLFKSGEAITNQVQYVLDRQGRPGWYNSSKLPLHNRHGKVVGLALVRFPINEPTEKQGRFRQLAPAIRALEERHREQLSMTELAKLAGLSSTHFNRQFAKLLGTTPTQLMHAMRIDRARQLLTHSERTLADIAVEVGYCDQSHFSRRFRQCCGTTPGQYRMQFRGQ
jgi:AraC-like DNA-binding protein